MLDMNLRRLVAASAIGLGLLSAPANAQFNVSDHVWSSGPDAVCWGPGCWTFNGEPLPLKTFPEGIKTGGEFPDHAWDTVRQPVPPNDWHWYVILPSGVKITFWFAWGDLDLQGIDVQIFESLDLAQPDWTFNVHNDADLYQIIVGPDMNGPIIWEAPWSGYPANLPPDWVQSNASRSYAVPCYPDCDMNGTLNILDFLCFQNAFTNGDPYADCNGDGNLNILDFLCLQNAFVVGCD